MEDHDRDLVNDLRQATYEIIQLRRDNEVLRAKVQTMELLGQFLHAERPRQGESMVQDIVWALDRHAQRIEDKPHVAAKGRASRQGGT
jgi:hypothetical protein